MHAKKNIIILLGNMISIEGLLCYRYDDGDNESCVVVAFEEKANERINQRMERNRKNALHPYFCDLNFIVRLDITETSTTNEN
jgi:hypothetical protein